jgi:uncharacterized protein
MKILIAGGTGFLGSALIGRFMRDGATVVVLSRTPADFAPASGTSVVAWDARTPGSWVNELEGADAVFNFSGRSLAKGRWTAKRKRQIIDSRIAATRALVTAMQSIPHPPPLFVNASAVGYYGNVAKGEVDEQSPHGAGFLAETCAQWEEEALRVASSRVRVVLPRLGFVVGGTGGGLARMAFPFRLFLGGTPGSGTQWFPWIHIDDVVGALAHVMPEPHLQGPVNLVAPGACTMKQFCIALGRSLRRPVWAPAPAFALRVVLGEMATMITEGQHVIPHALLRTGYKFIFPEASPALENIFR